MKRILLAAALCAAALGLGATCVNGVRQHGDDGPWTGDVTNTGDQTVHGVSAQADIFDANGVNVFGRVGVFACPSKLLPGERGAFELDIHDPGFNPLAGVPVDYELPLRALFQAFASESAGTGQARGDGLLVREMRRFASARVIEVELTNNSGAYYSEFTVCAITRDIEGELMIARADGPHLPFVLHAGESITLELAFRAPPAGPVRLHALGLWNHVYEPCCPANGSSLWHSVDTGPFSALLPPGWEYVPLQGIDSFIGAFKGDGVTLTFDYGWYSGDPEDPSGPAQDVHHETIGGRGVKVIVARDTTGTTGMFTQVTYIPPADEPPYRPPNLLSMYAEDLSTAEKEIVLQIFRSLRFDEP